MSEQLKDKCPVCQGYLFSDDDIVYCPICGAPHHRDCWDAVGHCGLEETHGTENQYKKEETEKRTENKSLNICPNCIKLLPDDAKFCPYCGYDKENPKDENQMPFQVINLGNQKVFKIDPLGGLKKDEKIEGVEVKDIAKFVSFGSHQILPKFKVLSEDKKAKIWNWFAFLSPYSNALFKKMYMQFFIYIMLELTAYVFLTPIYNLFLNINMPVGSRALDIAKELLANPTNYFNPYIVITAIIGGAIFFGMRIFAGFNQERLYKNHVITTIKKIRKDMDADDELEFAKKGGVRPFLSFFLFFVSTYFASVIPQYLIELLFY